MIYPPENTNNLFSPGSMVEFTLQDNTVQDNRCRRIVRRCLMMYALLCLFGTQVAFGQSSLETIEDVQPRVVKIFGAGGLKNLASYGTGFIVSPQGHIATFWSHVLDTDNVTVVLNNGRRYKAKVLGAEPQLDLAVLELDAENLDLAYFDLKKAASATAGTRILGFSNMFKVATGDEPVSVMHGVIASRTKLAARRGVYEIPYDGSVYIVDAVTNNSGAPGGVITTRDGRLLGMIGRELRNARSNTWVNYAIPVTDLRETIGQIITGDFVAREKKPDEDQNPNRYKSIDFGFVMVPDVLYRTPAYIDVVLRTTPAAKAGLRPDDLILFVNDELIQSFRMLQAELGRLEAGDTLRLVVRRESKLVSIDMPVPDKPAP